MGGMSGPPSVRAATSAGSSPRSAARITALRAKGVSEQAAKTGAGDIAGVSIHTEIIPQVSFVFLLSVIVHAVGDGLLAGVIQKGSVSIGLRHSFIMLVAGFVSLRIIG